MSWIRTEEGDAINLDQVERLMVVEITEEGSTEQLFAVVADSCANEDFDYLFTGDEKRCRDRLDYILTRLPLLKGV